VCLVPGPGCLEADGAPADGAGCCCEASAAAAATAVALGASLCIAAARGCGCCCCCCCCDFRRLLPPPPPPLLRVDEEGVAEPPAPPLRLELLEVGAVVLLSPAAGAILGSAAVAVAESLGNDDWLSVAVAGTAAEGGTVAVATSGT